MSGIVIKAENIGKLYKLGEIGTGTISHDLNRWWARVRGKEDPFAKLGQINDRTTKGSGDYVWALKDINFEVRQGEVLGIIGRNGAGKSTLLKILSKVTTPTTGRISVKGRIASLLEVGTGFHPELTGRENIFLNGAILGMSRSEVRAKFDEIVDFAGVERYIDTPVKRYSSGMYVRLAFAVAAFLEPEILIVDEVLAVGDAEFQRKCLGRMKDVSVKEGRTILFVSHSMGAISMLCSGCLFMEQGQIAYVGDVKGALKKYLYKVGSNFAKFDGVLSEAKILQRGSELVLTVIYNLQYPIDIPHLGFVIYDAMGTPVFGSNPTLDKLNAPISSYQSKCGVVAVTIKQPKLNDGEYSLSLWFGNSSENLVELLNCLRFKVVGMSEKKTRSSSISGAVIPECHWAFS